MTTLPLEFDRVLEVLAVATPQTKAYNRQKQERRSLTTLLADNMVLYLKDPTESPRKLLDLINTFNKVAGYKKINVF